MVNAWKFFKRCKCSFSFCNRCCRYATLKDDQNTQFIKLPNGDSLTIQGYEHSCGRSVILAILALVTFPLGLVVLATRPGGLIPWIVRSTNLLRATKIRLNGSAELKSIGFDEEGRRWFTWRQHRFTWCQQLHKFKRVRSVDEIGLRLTDIHGLGSGLDPSNHQLRKNTFGDNKTTINHPNAFWIYFTTLMRPFFIYQSAAIVIWCFNSYYIYAALIALMVLIEVTLRAVLKYRHQRRLHFASVVHGQSDVTVLSPGHERRQIAVEDLVPGCVIELRRGSCSVMPCDAVILSGSCLVFETGAPKFLHKYQLPRSRTEIYDFGKHRQHTLLRDSTVTLNTHETITALVIRTAWSTEHGTYLASKVLDEEDCSQSTFDRHANQIFFALALTGFAAFVYAACTLFFKLPSLSALGGIPTVLNFIIITLPPIFPTAHFFTAIYPLVRLYRRGFRFQSSANPATELNRTGITDTVCFLEKTVSFDSEINLISVASTKFKDWMDDPQLTLAMATCHSLTAISDPYGHLMGSSEELKVFPYTSWRFSATEAGHFGVQSTINDSEFYRVTRIYSRETPTTGPLILVRVDPAAGFNAVSWYFLKGAYASVMEYSHDTSFDITEDKSKMLVAFAGRPLTESERSSSLDPDLNLLFKKFQLLGLAALESKASVEAREVVTELRSAGIRTLLISRMGAEEAVQLAKSTGIIVSKEPVARMEIPSTDGQCPPSISMVDLPETGALVDGGDPSMRRHAHVVLDGATLDALGQSFPELVDQIVDRVTVFAAADVHQTERFLKRLRQLDRNILVCKGNEDYSPTVPGTCLTLGQDEKHQVLHRGPVTNSRTIRCIGELIRQSRASLTSSLGIGKVVICYAVARLTSALLVFNSSPSSSVQCLFIDVALVLLPILFYGWARPSSGTLSPNVPAKSNAQLKELVSLTSQLVLITAGQGFALMMAQHQPWFENAQVSLMDSPGALSTDENYAVYSTSLFQYLTIFLIFSDGPPHRQRIWTSMVFGLGLIGLFMLCSVIILQPPVGLQLFLGLKLPPVFDFRLAIFSLGIVYLFTSVGVQCLIDHCCFRSCLRGPPARPKPEGAPLESVTSINVLYRPISLTAPQPAGARFISTESSSTLNVSIF